MILHDFLRPEKYSAAKLRIFYTNLACEVAFRTHMCERGVVPNDQLYSIIAVRGTLTGTP